MIQLDLRKLEHVVAVADTLHFGRACIRVNLSQPALSRSIQALEESLGVELFIRSPRQVQLSPFGEVVVERARRILFEAAQMSNELRLMRDAAYGTISFGLGATPAALLAPRMLEAVSGLPVGAQVAIKRASTEKLVQMLYNDEVDLFCADVAPLDALEDRARLEVEELPQWPAALFCRAGHPLFATRGTVSRADVCRYPFASTKLSTFALAFMQQELRTPDGFARRVVMESDSFDDLVAAAESSDVILLASRPVVASVSRQHSLREVPLDLPFTAKARFGIVRLAGSKLPPIADMLVHLARKTFREYAQQATAAQTL
ncbi:LysR family transcriptional regulator [Cupriavidus sp. AcVe19-1a]|uniref:LysR family transcriptional regulator n=1 Tax=Cupriavidus sp. AcVe19-1a TaxID=2821359 RepID=UPI001AE78F52|nr:LysR family transcriptional regulator [Cupriavidus sp. AcVe19-1a]MBP0632376.1 LysR family transcriptional regulator [Cupriavidus sp. AcVe19-1a]